MKYVDMSSKEQLDQLSDVDKRGTRSTIRSRPTNPRRTWSPTVTPFFRKCREDDYKEAWEMLEKL